MNQDLSTSSDKTPWSSLDAVKALALLVILVPLTRYLEVAIRSVAVLPAVVETAIVIIFTYIIILLVTWYFTAVKYGTHPEDLGLTRFNAWRGAVLAIGWYLALRVILIFYGVVAALIGRLFNASPPQDLTTRVPGLFGGGWVGIVLAALVVVVIAPVVEEMFFRGFMYPAFKRRLGAGWGNAVSSLIFGIFHGSVWLIAPTALIGAVLAYMYEKERSLGPPIMLHSLNNLVSIIILYSVFRR